MMLRTTALMLVLGAGLIARAQAPGFHYFQAAQPLTTAQLKLATEAVMNADPYAELFHSDDRTIVQVKSPQLQPEALYRAAIAAQAVTLLPGTRTPDELGVNPAPAVPVYVPTGHEAADLARYRAAVEAWNAAHPDQPLSPTPVHAR